jgi:hypothetical protein
LELDWWGETHDVEFWEMDHDDHANPKNRRGARIIALQSIDILLDPEAQLKGTSLATFTGVLYLFRGYLRGSLPKALLTPPVIPSSWIIRRELDRRENSKTAECNCQCFVTALELGQVVKSHGAKLPAPLQA